MIDWKAYNRTDDFDEKVAFLEAAVDELLTLIPDEDKAPLKSLDDRPRRRPTGVMKQAVQVHSNMHKLARANLELCHENASWHRLVGKLLTLFGMNMEGETVDDQGNAL